MDTHRKLIAAMLLCATVAVPNIASTASISGQGTWETTLQGRDLDGDLTTAEAYYDTVLGITWLADANYAKSTGYNSYGDMPWNDAHLWTSNLDINDSTGWRLPAVNTGSYGDVCADKNTTYCGWNTDPSFSEFAHLFFTALGNTSYRDANGEIPFGWGLTNTGPFSNISDNVYWSSSYPAYEDRAWGFDFYNGMQTHHPTTWGVYVWPVHDGDIGLALPTSAVPIPAATWLFGTGLLGLVGVARRKTV